MQLFDKVRKNCMKVCFMFCTLHQNCYGDKIKENEIGSACGTHETETHMFLARNPSTKRPLAGLRHRWKGKINMDVMGKDNKEWTGFRRLT
jgi:hypothetical protein